MQDSTLLREIPSSRATINTRTPIPISALSPLDRLLHRRWNSPATALDWDLLTRLSHRNHHAANDLYPPDLWLAILEAHLQPFLDARAARLRAEADACCVLCKTAKLRQRAQGSENTILDLRACSARMRSFVRYGKYRVVRDPCDDTLLCERCAEKAARMLQARLRMSRGNAVQRATANTYALMHLKDRSLTLAPPQALDEMTRVKLLNAAIPLVIKYLKSAWKKEHPKLERFFSYFYSIEWQVGHDRLGHPHVHFWLLCPFIDIDVLWSKWKEILLKVGYPPDAVEKAICPVVHGFDENDGVLRHLNYITKGLLSPAVRRDPVILARVYIVLKSLNARSHAASKGFLLDENAVRARLRWQLEHH